MLKRRLRRCEYQCGLSLLPAGGVAADRPRLRGGSPVLHSLSGQRLLFLAMLFMGAVNATGLLAMLAGHNPNANLFAFGRSNAQTLISVYAMRMAAVFTLSVSTVGLRTSGLPRWVSYLGYLVALTLLLAAGEHKWFQLLFPTWVLLVSVVILFTRPHRPQ
jgi:hypothetical protein